MTPYGIPVAVALLKLPIGALAAVAGIILLGGSFVPGLSDLDPQRQILAYALVLGFAQQLVTQFIDRRAAALIAEVPSKQRDTPPTKWPPTPTTWADPSPKAAPEGRSVESPNAAPASSRAGGGDASERSVQLNQSWLEGRGSGRAHRLRCARPLCGVHALRRACARPLCGVHALRRACARLRQGVHRLGPAGAASAGPAAARPRRQSGRRGPARWQPGRAGPAGRWLPARRRTGRAHRRPVVHIACGVHGCSAVRTRSGERVHACGRVCTG